MEFINYNDFDHEFYIDNNIDLKNLKTKKLLYSHWYNYGCYENRLVRNIKSDKIVRFNISKTFKKPIINFDTSTYIYKSIPISIPIVIMLYIFNHELINYYRNHINGFLRRYTNTYIFIAVYKNNNKTDELLKFNDNTYIYDIENRGGDIGGFLFLIKKVMEYQNKYNSNFNRIIFFHTKTNNNWRNKLCLPLLNAKYEKYDNNIGIIAANRWILKFDVNKNNNKEKYQHLSKFYGIYGGNITDWEFVGGTIFCLHIDIIKYIYEHNINDIISLLNYENSIDNSWLNYLKKHNLNNKDCNNDYEYRKRYNKSLCSDYMIEHTFERIIGYINKLLGKKIMKL